MPRTCSILEMSFDSVYGPMMDEDSSRRLEIQFCLEHDKALTWLVMVWSAIACGSRCLLVFLERNMNAQNDIYNTYLYNQLRYHILSNKKIKFPSG